mgnify:CR=1 FL=1
MAILLPLLLALSLQAEPAREDVPIPPKVQAEVPAEDVGDVGLHVHGARIDGKAGALRRKAAFGFGETQLMPDEVHQVG